MIGMKGKKFVRAWDYASVILIQALIKFAYRC